MTDLVKIHPINPQLRLIRKVGEVLRSGGLIVYPTDSCYAFGCQMGARDAVDRIERIRKTGKHHNFTLVCRNLAEVATYARVADWAYRLLRAHTPGPYTFILPATREVPRRLQNPRRRTIGIRIPDHAISRAILDELREPIMSSTLLLPDEALPLNDPEEMAEQLGQQVELIVDGGSCGVEPTSVIDMTGRFPEVLRQGKGATTRFA
jgi:tRNA threonylcarbamoyl adenosine modification protein (Sua5/YciO/YrdC/YwlC family)